MGRRIPLGEAAGAQIAHPDSCAHFFGQTSYYSVDGGRGQEIIGAQVANNKEWTCQDGT
ncbi:MAG: hypothetical protein ABFD04_17270 [Syntrophomonas sp.]